MLAAVIPQIFEAYCSSNPAIVKAVLGYTGIPLDAVTVLSGPTYNTSDESEFTIINPFLTPVAATIKVADVVTVAVLKDILAVKPP